jgi:hypothetical protein
MAENTDVKEELENEKQKLLEGLVGNLESGKNMEIGIIIVSNIHIIVFACFLLI